MVHLNKQKRNLKMPSASTSGFRSSSANRLMTSVGNSNRSSPKRSSPKRASPKRSSPRPYMSDGILRQLKPSPAMHVSIPKYASPKRSSHKVASGKKAACATRWAKANPKSCGRCMFTYPGSKTRCCLPSSCKLKSSVKSFKKYCWIHWILMTMKNHQQSIPGAKTYVNHAMANYTKPTKKNRKVSDKTKLKKKFKKTKATKKPKGNSLKTLMQYAKQGKCVYKHFMVPRLADPTNKNASLKWGNSANNKTAIRAYYKYIQSRSKRGLPVRPYELRHLKQIRKYAKLRKPTKR